MQTNKIQSVPLSFTQQETDEEKPVCRTDRDLGQHHGFFGQRYYKYDDTECEGNRYITDEEL